MTESVVKADNHPESLPESKIQDEGLESGVANLSQAKIEKVINQILKEETSARFTAYLETCVHCGLCANACHFYLSNDKDPSFSPAGKVKQTIWEIVKRKGRVTPEMIRNMSRIAHTEFNLCKR